MLNVEKLEKALAHLEAQYANWQRLPGRQGFLDLDKEAVEESVIQRFEYSYDTAWKTLKHYMTEYAGLPNVPNSPKPLFRIAGENDCLAAPVEHWLEYANARVDTSHDYDDTKKNKALALAGRFIIDAQALLAMIKAEMYESA